MKTKLYKIELRGEANKSLAPRTMYLRCKSLKILTHAMESVCKAPYSEYYGYTSFDIETAKEFPEIIAVSITAKKKSKK